MRITNRTPKSKPGSAYQSYSVATSAKQLLLAAFPLPYNINKRKNCWKTFSEYQQDSDDFTLHLKRSLVSEVGLLLNCSEHSWTDWFSKVNYRNGEQEFQRECHFAFAAHAASWNPTVIALNRIRKVRSWKGWNCRHILRKTLSAHYDQASNLWRPFALRRPLSVERASTILGRRKTAFNWSTVVNAWIKHW